MFRCISCSRFLQLLGIIPTDAGILQKLGEIFDGENDKQQAYHYHFEVLYRLFSQKLHIQPLFFVFILCSVYLQGFNYID